MRFLFAILISLALACYALGQTYRTPNFVVSAPTQLLAQDIAHSAEDWRQRMATEWIGSPMPTWSSPCNVRVRVAPNLGAGGSTSFVFDNGHVFNWDMNIQGSRERILDSVLPHEITHTVFASYFRQPIPRWADEGACTTVEVRSEVVMQERSLIQFLKTGRGIPFSRMMAMEEYPRDVMPLYAQGHSVSSMLIEKHGKRAFVNFLSDGLRDDNWPRAVRDSYGYNNLAEFQNDWMAWVRAGRPRLNVSGPGTATTYASSLMER